MKLPAEGMVQKAIIPAAGLGSRMWPVTKVIPKEMLPAGRKPLIQHVVEEAVSAGIRQVCIVIREGKEVIRDHFSFRNGTPHKRSSNLEELDGLIARCEIVFVYQREPRGLGDALLQAKDFVGGEAFVMMLPDQLMSSSVPATLQLIRRWRPGPEIWTSLIRLSKSDVPFFGGARGFEFKPGPDAGIFLMGRLQTEDETVETYRNTEDEIRGFGRTVYPPEIFEYLGPNFINPETGEVDLLKTFEVCRERLGHYGVLLEGEALDLGSFDGYYRYLPCLWERGV